MTEKKKKCFNVAGVTFPNEKGWKVGDHIMTRLEIISKYVVRGTKFSLVRDHENEYDRNAIRVDAVFNSGRGVDIGYVPQGKKRLADELAPLIDWGADVNVSFGRKFINEEGGDCVGLMLRYEIE